MYNPEEVRSVTVRLESDEVLLQTSAEVGSLFGYGIMERQLFGSVVLTQVLMTHASVISELARRTMNIKLMAPIFYLLFGLTACGKNADIGNGFEIVDGTHGKLSLTRDGIVLINYTVTGVGHVGSHKVIENKSYDSVSCDYYVIDANKRELVRLKPGQFGSTQVTIEQAAQAVKALNYRSCKPY
jgi:hypothetical protein